MSEPPTFPDPFEFVKSMWAQMGLPMQGMVAPLLSVNDVDKRISDLKSVEQWLNLNLSVLRMSIQGLQMQRATLVALQAMQPQPSGSQEENAPPQNPAATAAEAWWNMFQQAQSALATPDEKKPK